MSDENKSTIVKSYLFGDPTIGEGCYIINSTIKDGVIIGDNCTLVDCIINSGVIVEDDTTMIDSIVHSKNIKDKPTIIEDEHNVFYTEDIWVDEETTDIFKNKETTVDSDIDDIYNNQKVPISIHKDFICSVGEIALTFYIPSDDNDSEKDIIHMNIKESFKDSYLEDIGINKSMVCIAIFDKERILISYNKSVYLIHGFDKMFSLPRNDATHYNISNINIIKFYTHSDEITSLKVLQDAIIINKSSIISINYEID